MTSLLASSQMVYTEWHKMNLTNGSSIYSSLTYVYPLKIENNTPPDKQSKLTTTTDIALNLNLIHTQEQLSENQTNPTDSIRTVNTWTVEAISLEPAVQHSDALAAAGLVSP